MSEKITNKLIIEFKDGHIVKRNIYTPEGARIHIKIHPRKKEIKSAVWYDSSGKKFDPSKIKDHEIKGYRIGPQKEKKK